MGGLWLKASGGGVYQRGMKLSKFETSSMKIICVFFLPLLFYVYIHLSYEFSSYSLFLVTFADITWFKGTCPVHEVGRKVSGVIEKFQSSQSESDVLSMTRLVRASLIEENLSSSSGGESRIVIWCCWGTLPSLVLWGAPIICTTFLFLFWRPYLIFLNVSFCL